MRPLKAGRFAEFFEALHGKEPFPWQVRLAEQVISAPGAEQAWPERIALPAASGKTACIDIAVFALACHAAEGAGRRSPRRIFFVVDRRLIVDHAYLRAEESIAKRLAKPDCEILRRVAEALCDLAREPSGRASSPLLCYQLHGGVYRDDAWVRSPTQPLVVCGTVDEIGSRLLFRGYGVSDKSRALHAGLIANDSLIVVDEAHCAVPFEQTIQAIRRYRGRSWAQCPLESPFSVTVMSATPRNDGIEPFTLQEADYEHATLGLRLRATKPATLVKFKGKTATPAFAAALANQALALAERGARRIAILVNRVDSARMAYQSLHLPDERKALFLGRMRPLDSQQLMRSWEPRLRAADNPPDMENAVFVVATQCLEVGADFDFDGMVCECASLDALQQRFGRLKRLGTGRSDAVIAISAEDAKGKQPDPVYGAALASTWEWLNAYATRKNAESSPEIDMGVEAVSGALASTSAETRKKLFAASENAPVMLPAHLDCWVQTSPRPEPDPDASLFLHGPNAGAPEVKVCWRADLDFDPRDPRQPTGRQKRQWIGALAVCPPALGECMSAPLHQLRRWMSGQSLESKLLSDVEGVDVFAESSGAGGRRTSVVRWYGPSDDKTAVVNNPTQVQPGDTVVIPSTLKGWEHFGHIPRLSPGEAATDLGDEANFVARGRPILRIHRNVVRSWTAGASKTTTESIEKSAARLVELSRSDELIETIEESKQTPWLDELRQELARLSAIPDIPAWLRRAATLYESPYFEETLRLHPCGWPASSPSFEGSDDLGVEEGRRAFTNRGSNDCISADDAPALGGLVLIGPQQWNARQPIDRFTHEDDSSLSTTQVPLAEHLEGVAQFARHYATACGMTDGFRDMFELVGRLHDIGKLDERFQAWLQGGAPTLAFAAAEPLAKSSQLGDYQAREAARRKSKYPPRGRHELLSVQLAAVAADEILRDSADPELVLHLIASHHGHCRPFAPHVADDFPPAVQWDYAGVAWFLSESRRAEWKAHALDSGVADRFWRLVRKYGWWGLAWLESILILADCSRSDYEVAATAESRAAATFQEANR